MENVIKVNVNVTLDGQVINVINFLVMRDAPSMDSVEMVHVSVLGDGMANIVLFVSHHNNFINAKFLYVLFTWIKLLLGYIFQRAAKMVVVIKETVSYLITCILVYAMKDGKEKIVQFA